MEPSFATAASLSGWWSTDRPGNVSINACPFLAIWINVYLEKYREVFAAFWSVHKGAFFYLFLVFSRGCAIFLATPRFFG